jgi:hypothetical protein
MVIYSPGGSMRLVITAAAAPLAAVAPYASAAPRAIEVR